MANFQHRRDRALVRFCGELTREATVDLVETIDMLVRVYFYVLIEIQISSLGGASSALEHYLDAHRRWRAAGVRVRTRVVERAASAAALMLSLGDERIAEPGASLLYHLFRLPSNAPVTASAAALMFADLTRLDEQCVARLVERAMADADRATTVSVDVEPSDLQVLRLLTADLPSGAKGRARTLRGLARALERAVRRALRANDRATLVEIYRKLCRSELSVSPAVARLLRLIDRVGTAQAPSSVAPQAPGLTIPHWAALYPPAGEVPRETLLRHTLALGDSGSGKTCSAILPVLRSLVEAPPGRVGCALVIDPKGEIGPVLERDAAKRLRRIVPSESGVDLMTGPDWRLGADLAHARYLTAAHRIVRRVLSFEPSLPTRVLADHQHPAETTNAEFFDREGTSLLIVVLAFVLMVTDECSPPPEHWCADAEMTGKWMRALLERAHGRAGARGPNALALAAYVLDTAVALGGPTFDPDPDEDFDDPPWRFATVARAAASVWRNGEGETPDVIDRVLRYWHPMARLRAQFGGVVASARAACGAIAEPALARTVYFGCEPGAVGSDAIGRDFARAVSPAAPGQLLLYQPSRSGVDTLVGKVVKALYFEAVLNDPDRQRASPDTPIAGYVADEFHRFATSDAVHGEQGFLDTCRSFGVACVLACHSLASLEHALAQRGGSAAQDRAALSMVWNTAGSKLFFRSTDPRTADRVDDVCPTYPALTRVTLVRPLASLAPGECYAALADGRFERRQLAPVLPAAPERSAARRPSRRARPSRGTRVRPGSES